MFPTKCELDSFFFVRFTAIWPPNASWHTLRTCLRRAFGTTTERMIHPPLTSCDITDCHGSQNRFTCFSEFKTACRGFIIPLLFSYLLAWGYIVGIWLIWDASLPSILIGFTHIVISLRLQSTPSKSPIGLCGVLRPRQHSTCYNYGRRFLQVKRPSQQYQSTEGDATEEKAKNENN